MSEARAKVSKRAIMKRVLIDGEWLAVELPKGFDAIEHNELGLLMGTTYDCIWGVRHEKRHIIMSATWKDSGKLVTKLVSEKGFAQQMDKTFTKRYRKRGYRCDGYFERDIRGASAKACGFDYSYTVAGVAHVGKVLVFKRGIRCYTLCYYTQSDRAESNSTVYERIIGSLEVR